MKQSSSQVTSKWARFALLILVPFAGTVWFWNHIAQYAQIDFDLTKVSVDGLPEVTPGDVTAKQQSTEAAIDRLTPFIKVPISLLSFDVYAVNNLAVDGAGEDIPTTVQFIFDTSTTTLKTENSNDHMNLFLNISQGSTTPIQTGEELVLSNDVPISAFLDQPFGIDIKINNHKSIDLAPLTPKKDQSTIHFYAVPSLRSCLLVYFALLALMPGVYVLLNSWYRFVVQGHPFTKKDLE